VSPLAASVHSPAIRSPVLITVSLFVYIIVHNIGDNRFLSRFNERNPEVSSTTLTMQLRAAIVAGSFQPGERLIESELVERFDATRRAVRDALAELDKEGLVVREANRGASVRKVTLEEAIEITQVRSLLEGLLAAETARQATDEERQELKAIVERMRTATKTDPVGGFPPLYQEFHQHLRAAGRHGIAADLVENLRNRNAQFQFRTALLPGRVEESFREHEAIASAILASDEQAAREAMETHLSALVEVLRAWRFDDTFV
jgi:DNA-binding GntR family transcriptional regulator